LELLSKLQQTVKQLPLLDLLLQIFLLETPVLPIINANQAFALKELALPKQQCMQLALLMTTVPCKDGAKSQILLVCQLSLLVVLVLQDNQLLKLFLNADMELIASTLNALFLTLSPMEILVSQPLKELLNGEPLFVNPELPPLELPTGSAFLLPRFKMPQIS
jgi:hypothetical protein